MITKPFLLPLRVYYEDTDSAGVVYHASYLRFMERCRSEYLRHLGFSQQELRQQSQILFVVRRMCIDYCRPAYLDQMLYCSVSTERISGAQLHFIQQIYDHADATVDKTALCHATVDVACIDAQRKRPCAIPPVLRQQLSKDAHSSTLS